MGSVARKVSPVLVLQPRRLFLLGLLAALVISYVGPVRGYRTRQAELRQQEIELRNLVKERDRIRERLAKSNTRAAIEARAREIGFIKPGEIQYRVEGLGPPSAPSSTKAAGGLGSWFPTVV